MDEKQLAQTIAFAQVLSKLKQAQVTQLAQVTLTKAENDALINGLRLLTRRDKTS